MTREDERVVLEGIDAGVFEGLPPRECRELARLDLRTRPAALADPRYPLEPAGLEAEPLADAGALFDFGGRDDGGRNLRTDAGDANSGDVSLPTIHRGHECGSFARVRPPSLPEIMRPARHGFAFPMPDIASPLTSSGVVLLAGPSGLRRASYGRSFGRRRPAPHRRA